MKQILHILILTAFLGGIIAPACGVAWGGQYSVIEICTAQGLESRVVSNDQDSDTPHPTMQDQCQFCFTSAHLTSFLADHRAIGKINFTAEKLKFDLYKTAYLSRQYSDHAARAPPALI